MNQHRRLLITLAIKALRAEVANRHDGGIIASYSLGDSNPRIQVPVSAMLDWAQVDEWEFEPFDGELAIHKATVTIDGIRFTALLTDKDMEKVDAALRILYPCQYCSSTTGRDCVG